VQHVGQYFIKLACGNCPNVLDIIGALLGRPTLDYYEAWPIAKGQNRPAFGDKFELKNFASANSCGWAFQTGEARFYCRNPWEEEALTGEWAGTGDLGSYDTNPSDPSSPWRPLPITDGLPATFQQPPFWSAPPVEGPASHSMTWFWCCCPAQFLRGQPDPD
jgi:hypothetical protein